MTLEALYTLSVILALALRVLTVATDFDPFAAFEWMFCSLVFGRPSEPSEPKRAVVPPPTAAPATNGHAVKEREKEKAAVAVLAAQAANKKKKGKVRSAAEYFFSSFCSGYQSRLVKIDMNIPLFRFIMTHAFTVDFIPPIRNILFIFQNYV